MEITLEEIKKKFESLPENLKWAIMGANVDDNIIEIGQKQGLNVEQLGQLSLETHMEMFGFTPIDKFEESVKNSLKLSAEKTKKLIEAINEKILKKIREELIKNSERKETYEQKQTFPTQLSATQEEGKNKNAGQDIMKSAGIEIINPTSKLSTTFPPNTAPVANNPMLSQKMAQTFQIPMVKTEHSLDNLSKPATSQNSPLEEYPLGGGGNASTPSRERATPQEGNRKITDIKTPVPQAKDYSKTGDPYRLNPNE